MAADVKVPPLLRPAWATWGEFATGAPPPLPAVPFCAAPAAVATSRTAPAPTAVALTNLRVHRFICRLLACKCEPHRHASIDDVWLGYRSGGSLKRIGQHGFPSDGTTGEVRDDGKLMRSCPQVRPPRPSSRNSATTCGRVNGSTRRSPTSPSHRSGPPVGHDDQAAPNDPAGLLRHRRVPRPPLARRLAPFGVHIRGRQ